MQLHHVLQRPVMTAATSCLETEYQMTANCQ